MKTVLITGASKGIGAAIALKFAQNNYNIILNYKNDDEKALEIYNKLMEYNVDVLIAKADVSNEVEVKNMFEICSKHFETIDCIVNNAGICCDTILDDKTPEMFKKILDTNLVGPFLICKYFGKYMYEQKKGNVINISSTNGIDTYYPYSMDYDASKAGLISMTKNFAVEFAPYIRVNSVAPGWVLTDMNKELDEEYKKTEENKILLKRFAEPIEIANVVYFLATDDASFINGSIITVDGGK